MGDNLRGGEIIHLPGSVRVFHQHQLLARTQRTAAGGVSYSSRSASPEGQPFSDDGFRPGGPRMYVGPATQDVRMLPGLTWRLLVVEWSGG